ncbi:MAG: site-specific integrase, partial [Alphaproteobacteria bacterium]
PNDPDGFHTWSLDEVRQFEKRHPVGSKARRTLAIFMYTGVRTSDAVQLGPQMERDGSLHFTEMKNRDRDLKHRVIPILAALRVELDAGPTGHLCYLVTEWGKPYSSPNSFGNRFKSWCRQAGLPHCSAHGLRKAGAVFAAEQGATPHQLMAIFGWKSLRQAELYTRAANEKKLAAQAMHLLDPDRTENKSVPPQRAVASSGTMRGKKS